MTPDRTVALLIVAIPTIAAMLGVVLARRPRIGIPVALAGSLAVLVGCVAQWAQLGLLSTSGRSASVALDTAPGFGGLVVGELVMPFELVVDRQSVITATVVAIVGLAVQAYAVWYLADDPRCATFAATVSMFVAAMLLVVMSADLVLTLIGWEVMGWGSYLLIGHLSTREAARRAAFKAFLVTRFADAGFVLGILILAALAKTTSIPEIIARFAGLGWVGQPPTPGAAAAVTSALILIAVGVAGKSGLVPFHDWLPDAMQGPTPASALIHGATMVAAGTVVIARLHPLYVGHPAAAAVLAVLASITMIWAALLAFAQTDLKRLLAYSTLSQVAVMLSGLAVVGVGSADPSGAASTSAGLAHMHGHAFFKALLFLAAGWLAAGAAGTAIAALHGRTHWRSPLGFSLLIGLGALAGVPPLVGFFTKEGVIHVAERAALDGSAVGWVVLIALLVTVALTAAYVTRLALVIIAFTPSAAASGTGSEGAGLVTAWGRWPVLALALCTTLGGVVVLASEAGLAIGVLTTLVSLALVGGAGYAVWQLFRRTGEDPVALVRPSLIAHAQTGFGIDRAYVWVAERVVALGRLVVLLDRDVVDAYPRGVARATLLAGRAAERGHRAVPSSGLVAVLTGLVAALVIGVVAWR